jgi:hypothetical protein
MGHAAAWRRAWWICCGLPSSLGLSYISVPSYADGAFVTQTRFRTLPAWRGSGRGRVVASPTPRPCRRSDSTVQSVAPRTGSPSQSGQSCCRAAALIRQYTRGYRLLPSGGGSNSGEGDHAGCRGHCERASFIERIERLGHGFKQFAPTQSMPGIISPQTLAVATDVHGCACPTYAVVCLIVAPHPRMTAHGPACPPQNWPHQC